MGTIADIMKNVCQIMRAIKHGKKKRLLTDNCHIFLYFSVVLEQLVDILMFLNYVYVDLSKISIKKLGLIRIC